MTPPPISNAFSLLRQKCATHGLGHGMSSHVTVTHPPTLVCERTLHGDVCQPNSRELQIGQVGVHDCAGRCAPVATVS
eukprot:1048482-Pleurochrysis_carterae.AAC.1